MLKLAAERGVLDVVDRTMEMSVGLKNRQTATVGSQVRMVVGSEEEVAYAIFFRNNTAKAAHKYSLSDWGKFALKGRNFARYGGVKFLIIAFQENYNQDINGV